MASRPQTYKPRLAGKYRYKWHSAAFLAAMFVIAVLALGVTLVSSGGSSSPLLDNETMSAAREMASMMSPKQIPLAQAGNLQLMLPIYEKTVTVIGFQPVNDANVVSLTPLGRQVDGSAGLHALSEISPQGGPQYVVLDGGDESGSQIGEMDVGAPAGSSVFAPVDGVVVGISDYSIDGQCPDTMVKIQPQAQMQVLVVLSHVDQPAISLGQPVRSGVTRIGTVRGLAGCLDQPLKQYTSDNGNHLQLQVEAIN